ncbi:hypothetical protein TNCV_151531 [Trichonephila clavipes]|uniref:Transposase n=1 Tax=Trichonephila clavipes TaxID=2585209 RepID=A0A8X6V341_TRICX|nr:hypothetical protein TNCV_151531 [Trichonephila clavipes]
MEFSHPGSLRVSRISKLNVSNKSHAHHLLGCKWCELHGIYLTKDVTVNSVSPDLTPSDFWLFPKLKETLKGQRFSTVAKVQAAVCKWICSQPESFFMNGMKKWIERLNKCVAFSGDYVGKNECTICKRVINFLHSDTFVNILPCREHISYYWRPFTYQSPLAYRKKNSLG